MCYSYPPKIVCYIVCLQCSVLTQYYCCCRLLRTLQNNYIEMLATLIIAQDLASTKESTATRAPPYLPVNHSNDDDNDNHDNHGYNPCLFSYSCSS